MCRVAPCSTCAERVPHSPNRPVRARGTVHHPPGSDAIGAPRAQCAGTRQRALRRRARVFEGALTARGAPSRLIEPHPTKPPWTGHVSRLDLEAVGIPLTAAAACAQACRACGACFKAQLWINCCCIWRRAFGRFQRASASIGSRMRFGDIRPSARPCPAPQPASLPPASRHSASFPTGSWKCAQDSSTS